MLPETLRIDGRKPRIQLTLRGFWLITDGSGECWRRKGVWSLAGVRYESEAEAEAAAYLAADLPPGWRIELTDDGFRAFCLSGGYSLHPTPADAYAACWAAASEACPNRETVADEPQGWRDIATAPRDGTHVLLYSPERCGNCSEKSTGVSSSYWQNGWMVARLLSGELIGVNHQPTHWQPLPAPPQEQPDEAN